MSLRINIPKQPAANGTLSLTVQGGMHESVQELTAYLSKTDAQNKPTEEEIGVLNIISYDKQYNTLVLVPVNNTSLPISPAALQQELNKIYSQAVVQWQVLTATTTPKVIAHELAHGAFRLEHTFPELPQNGTNLMDYSTTGTQLHKHQWDLVHSPQAMLGLFEDDEEGAMVGAPQPVIVYVNGYWNKDWPILAGGYNLRDYWGSKFIDRATTLLNTEKEYFINGANTYLSSGNTRFEEGKKFVNDRFSNKQSDFYKNVIQSVQDDKGNFVKPLYFVSHSMGSAFAEGMISVLQEKGARIDKVYHFSPADVSGFSATLPDKTYEIDIFPDFVLAYKNLNDAYYIKNIRFFGIVNNPEGVTDIYGHYYTKAEGFVWDWAEDLISGSIIPDGEITYLYPSGDPGGVPFSKPAYRFNSLHNTIFNHLLFNGVLYTRDGNKYIKK